MKKLVLALLAGGLSLSASAQFVELGVHGGVGTTWLINNNVSDQDDQLDPAPSCAPLVGLHAGFFPGRKAGLRVELNYSTINQRYEGQHLPLYNFQSRDRATYLDIPLLFQLKSNTFYFEIGPQVSFLMSATNKLLTNAKEPPYLDHDGKDIKSGFRNTVVSGVLGLGGDYPVCHNLRFNVGIRLVYGFTDATKELSQNELYNLSVQDKLGISSIYAHTSQNGSFSYQSTHIAAGYITAGFTCRIPGKSKAKARSGSED